MPAFPPLRNSCRAFIAAIGFLTVIPVPASVGDHDPGMAASLPYFPLVGLFLGLGGSLATLLFWSILPQTTAAALVVLYLVLISGGLHMDGLADTADGFFCCRERKRMLAVMRDSRIGTMGMLAVVFVLLVKTGALASLDRRRAMQTTLLMPLAGRCAILMLMALCDYVRPQGGLGTGFFQSSSRTGLGILGSLFLLGFAVAISGWKGLGIALGVCFSVFLFGRLCRQKIGGVTGDTLGAGSELAEALTALLYSAI